MYCIIYNYIKYVIYYMKNYYLVMFIRTYVDVFSFFLQGQVMGLTARLILRIILSDGVVGRASSSGGALSGVVVNIS